MESLAQFSISSVVTAAVAHMLALTSLNPENSNRLTLVFASRKLMHFQLPAVSVGGKEDKRRASVSPCASCGSGIEHPGSAAIVDR
jgi:hypothetical protein